MIGLVSRADEAVRFRETERGRRQGAALRDLEQGSGRKRSAIVADLDDAIRVGHDQYRRYLRGDTPLRIDQFDAFAAAYRVTKADLARALGLLDDDVDAALRARAAEAVGPDFAPQMGRTLDAVARTLAQHGTDIQDEVLEQIRSVLAAQRGGDGQT